MTAFTKVLIAFFAWFASPVWAQICAIPGFTGPTATLTGAINTFYAGDALGASGTTVNFGAQRAGASTIVFAVGDLMLIMQMQGASINSTDTALYGDGLGANFARQDATVPVLPAPSPTVAYDAATNGTNGYAGGATAATAGIYEYAVVTQIVSATQVRVRGAGVGGALLYAYTQTAGPNQASYQVIRVPQRSSATISGALTAPAWDGSTGGVVALDVAGLLTFNAGIDVSQRGFRGGGVRNIGAITAPQFGGYRALYATNLGGMKGEGIAGTPARVYDSFNNTLSALAGADGYTNGDVGRGAPGNAGGGGNQHNAGGGGGGNAGAGGNGGGSWNANTNGQSGWQTGGFGGFPIASTLGSAARLFMGGGGGAGDVGGNGSADPEGSGANGGGIILVRAGSIAGTATLLANGGSAPNTGSTDSAGGAGAGGSILVRTLSGAVTGLTLQANGGTGGSTNMGAANPEQDGPGGGGGGGAIYTAAGAIGAVNAGLAGVLTTGNTAPTDPPNYYARAGQVGTLPTVGLALDAAGSRAGFECLPDLSVSKSTSLGLVTATTAATTSYSIVVSNAALSGGATNVTVFDQTLPPGWTLASAAGFQYSPASSATLLGAGADNVGGVVGGLPDQNINSQATVFALQPTPDANATAGQNALRWGTFFLDQGSTLTITYTVNIPDAASVGTYHNSAGLSYLDPTRLTANRLITPPTHNGANRLGTNYTNNITHASGGTTTVSGSNYSGRPEGPSAEDVVLLGDLSVSKIAAPASVAAGQTLLFTITPRNNGRAIADINFSTQQATTITNAVPATALLLGSTVRMTDTLPSGITLLSAPTGAGWTCSLGTNTATCSLNTLTLPIAAASNFNAITVAARVTSAGCPGPQINSASVGDFASPYTDAQPSNNTGTASVSLNCNANLSITKTNTVTSLTAGGTTSYLISATNAGPASADGAVLRDIPSAGLSCTVSNCAASGGSPVATCPAPANWPNLLTAGGVAAPSFPSGGNIQFTVNCNVTATGVP